MNIDEFEVDDYKLKLDYLKSQFDRMWTRFNFFLSIEVALFGFLGWLVFEKDNPNATPLPALLGLAVSGLWYVIGAQDRALVEFYRSNVSDAANRISARCKTELQWYGNEHAAAEAKSVFNDLTSWYWKKASITRLPAVVSLMLMVIWLVLLLYGRHLFKRS
jgi:hypothetical protein